MSWTFWRICTPGGFPLGWARRQEERREVSKGTPKHFKVPLWLQLPRKCPVLAIGSTWFSSQLALNQDWYPHHSDTPTFHSDMEHLPVLFIQLSPQVEILSPNVLFLVLAGTVFTVLIVTNKWTHHLQSLDMKDVEPGSQGGTVSAVQWEERASLASLVGTASPPGPRASFRAGTGPWQDESRTRTWCRGWCSHRR